MKSPPPQKKYKQKQTTTNQHNFERDCVNRSTKAVSELRSQMLERRVCVNFAPHSLECDLMHARAVSHIPNSHTSPTTSLLEEAENVKPEVRSNKQTIDKRGGRTRQSALDCPTHSISFPPFSDPLPYSPPPPQANMVRDHLLLCRPYAMSRPTCT